MYIFQQMKKSNNARIRYNKGESPADSAEWYRDQAATLGSVDTDRIMGTAGAFKLFPELSGASIGKLYMFYYDPKHKATLPFYDRFPLVFPLSFEKNTMLGLNLHYLPPIARCILMDALYTVANNDKYNKNMRLIVTYDILKASSIKFSGFQDCIKRYLFDHVRSPFHYVNPGDWDKALLLPTQRWIVNPDKKYAGSPPY